MSDKLIKRFDFSKIKSRGEMPNFLEFQLSTYDFFLQSNKKPLERLEQGLEKNFKDMFPIESSNGKVLLEYFGYELREKKNTFDDELECKKRGRTYAYQLKVNLKLTNKKTKKINESWIHFGDIPRITDKATFVINGAERVVVTQLHRSPGVSFQKDTNVQTGKEIFSGKIVPYKGTWLEFETDKNDVLNLKIDRKKKVNLALFLKAIGFFESNVEIMDEFFETKKLNIKKYFKTNTKFEDDHEKSIEKLMLKLDKKFIKTNKIDPETGEILIESGTLATRENLEKLFEYKVEEIEFWDYKPEDILIAEALLSDKTKTVDEASIELFKKMRPGDLVTLESSKNFIKQVFFNIQRYSLALVGRYKLNKRLKIKVDEKKLFVTKKDVIAIIKYLQSLFIGEGAVDDIDNLFNRRVRGVGELLEIQIRNCFSRMAKIIKEKTIIQEITAISFQSLLNVKPLNAAILEFFGSGQLSQFMDQSNPLAELTHKRRISALGPGGLSRERAGFEVRDVHNSHYGRICPIETPEGPNIGLIGSLTTYGKINKYGFIETPYLKVKNGKTELNDLHYLDASEEIGKFIAQANSKITDDGTFIEKEILCRYNDETVKIDKKKVNYLDVSAKQTVSISAALIPFLEHDDVSRALMGSNMQRQAVPLLKTEAPYIGTGIERKVAVDSGSVMVAKHPGIVKYVDASKIKIEEKNGIEKEYHLLNFVRSNQAMCLMQKPLVEIGQKIKKGDIIADGPSTCGGDLALGRNVTIAFMPWEGYNFEDSILISDRLIKEDVFTSIHIEVYEVEERSTKMGNEEVTREVPNVGEDALKDLDDFGIVRIGAQVKPGDILVGKITPKGDGDPPVEEKLLRAIFGEKARDVRDSSLKLPHGAKGTVIEVLEISRKNGDDLPTGANTGVNKIIRVYVAEKRKMKVGDKISGRHGNKGVVSLILPVEDMPYMEDGTPVDILLNPLGVPSRMNIGQVLETHLGLAAGKLNKYIKTPIFDSATIQEIKNWLAKAGYSKTGKVKLYDGRTGNEFDNDITVGNMYILKLHHLVEDKLHARSIGPYSLVSQQPLGGKAQFGGQRLGEMEVWALEAYGAANVLQEMITVKSDDVIGRSKTYEAIVKGESIPEPDMPESFRVLLREFNSLGLNVELYDDENNIVDLKEVSTEEK